MDEKRNSTQCIALRLRRTISEDAYINVPVTERIVKAKEDGTYGIDMDAFVAEGVHLSQDARVEWRREEIATQPHPIQQPMPTDRTRFDVHVE
jgi:hypothetical protein